MKFKTLVFPGISESAETYHQSWTQETHGTRLLCGKDLVLFNKRKLFISVYRISTKMPRKEISGETNIKKNTRRKRRKRNITDQKLKSRTQRVILIT